MNFLKSFGVWAAFTSVPAFVVYLYAGPSFRGADYVAFFLPSLLIPLVGCALLWILLPSPGTTLVAGILVGLLVPILGGFAWVRIFPGFESEPAIFLGSLMIAGPSAAGGGLAAWLCSRTRRVVGE